MKDKIQLLAGIENPVSLPTIPFFHIAIEFLNQVSITIRQSEELRQYDDIAAFGFWCRKSHLISMRDSWKKEEVRIGRGIVFHISPSNLPILFGYSFAISLLAGNSNVVRVSSRNSKETYLLCSCLNQVMNQPEFISIKEQTLICSYERNEEITQYYSSLCDARMIWGGDETVNKIKQIPVNPRTLDLCFPDRNSICLLNPLFIKELSEEDLKVQVRKFYNDTYVMDQNGCSCPKLIVWFNSDKITQKDLRGIQNKWWDQVYEEAVRYDLTDSKVSNKYADLCEYVMAKDCHVKVNRYENRLYVVNLIEVPNDLRLLKGRFGMFYQMEVNSLEELITCIDTRLQTLTYAGYLKEELVGFLIRNNLKGIDRIVPIGQALLMDLVWDGIDLIGSLSRIIR